MSPRCPRTHVRKAAVLALLALLALPSIGGAQVPGQVDFQGLLLDAAGDPVNGLVDLDFALFDVDTGGSALWSELHTDVSVVDGVYDVALGSITPLTPTLLAGSSVYLEITVDGETLTPRRQLLAVPYALRAAEADAAATVGGFSQGYFNQMIQYFAFDGPGPSNLDPREGLADADGDGRANFIDSDNDDDGLTDAVEVSQGSDINLVTPTLTSFAPPSAPAAFPAAVTVNGTNFQAGMTLQFGAESPTPMNVTATSFDVDVSQAPAGDATVLVMLPNGESVSATYPRPASLAIMGVSPPSAVSEVSTLVTVTGTGFGPGLTVDAFGSETPTPMNVTPTSFQVQVGPQAAGIASVMISLPNGETASSSFDFRGHRWVLVTPPTSGNLGGLAGADALCALWAANSGVAGSTFLPWLADTTESPATRFVQSGIPYKRLDGTLIADDWADLVDGTLDAPVTPAGGASWANVALPGATAAGASCNDWTSSSELDTGRGGNGALSNSSWTNSTDAACNSLRILCCFE